MKRRRPSGRFAGAAVLAACLGLAAATWAQQASPTAAPGDQGGTALNEVEPRLRLLERLLLDLRRKLTATSAESNGAAYEEELHTVEELVRQARLAQVGAQASLALELANQALQKTTRLAQALRQRGPNAERLRAQYRERIDAVTQFRAALLDAARRKGIDPATLDLAEVDAMTQEAAERATANDLASAVTAVNAAYRIVSASLAAVRANDTEVHRLEFASPSEEYRYERSRYQSYEALTRMLMQERQWDAGLVQRMRTELERADGLAQEADAMAADGAYDRAIATQEAALSGLIAALRIAGLYVPR